MSYIGINIGALTVKVAALRGDARSATVWLHQGRPLEVLDEVLAGPEFADAEYFGVSGQLGHISEVAGSPAGASGGGRHIRRGGLAGRRVLPRLPPHGRENHQCAFPQQMRGGKRRVFRAADRPDGAGHGGSDPALVRRQGRAAGLTLLGALQIGHHPQAQPQRSHARGHSPHAARQHGQQGDRAAGEGAA